MESLAVMVFVLWCCVFLCGPLAVLFNYLNRPLISAILALASIWLGIFWFAHVFTWPRYLGLFSAAMGLYVVWRTAKRI